MAEIALLTRYTQDVGLDTRGLARFIGTLEEGRSKVSVNSALSPNDRQDYFRFRMTAAGFARIRTGELVGEEGRGNVVAKDGTVRYQLLTASGRVIADSDPSSTTHQEWLDLSSDANLELSKGSYTLRVARGPESVDRKDYVYSFTLRSGREPVTDEARDLAVREFLTTERPAAAGSELDRFAHVTSVLGLFVDVQTF